MKKALKIVGYIFAFVLMLLVWWDQGSRSFYCFSNGKCFTIWKRVGGKCYFIPHKYYGIIAPHEYVLTSNKSYIDVINDSHFPNNIIVVGDSNCKIVSQEKSKIIFYYSKNTNVDNMYTHKQGDYRVYNDNIDYYLIDILEMYVRTNVKK